ncbi:hypothetical protein Pan44_00450 [Caulifigura coniformis]|uniref:Uncharacterized protein n=2 Tax=Caulifigura coniformis TaxID=2527983 RepID=A0A517S7D3_9PLAN|nr:hypothetical protein Pan44_00450 [Caulifigura coniformis]
MNYLAHALRFLDRPYYVAGACLPDLLSVADRGVRLRSRRVEPMIPLAGVDEAELYRGVLQHLHDDDWFHATRGFAEVTGDIAVLFRKAIGTEHPTPCSFLGHIVMEMLLDSVLIERHPDALDRFYAAMEEVDPQRIQAAVNQCARQPTERLAPLLPQFNAERFLFDYASAEGLAYRLNQVLRRVRLTPLDETAIGAITSARDVVEAKIDQLLPPSLFVPEPVTSRVASASLISARPGT